jgi:tetratricopeptide (TPR) repeat protein
MPTPWTIACLALLVAACASPLERAESALLRGDYDEAEALYRKAAQKPHTQATAERGIADVYAERAREREASDPEGAEQDYREALALLPGHEDALTGLVRLLRSQGRLDEASAVVEQAKATGECGGSCARLTLVLLLVRGDQAFAAKRWDDALAAYTEAQRIREQPAGAVAIAATYHAAGRLDEAEAALRAVQSQMTGADASTTDRFLELHRALLGTALAAGDFERADRLREIRLLAEPASRRLELALLVADTVHQQGKDLEAALARYEELLQDPEMSEVDRATIARKVALGYATLGTRDLHDGRAEEADARLSRAIELQPDDWPLKLQRILALSGRSGAEPALASLSQVPAQAAGLSHVQAILLSLRVREEVARGELEAARATLEQAEQANPDLPEVHLASASVLAHSPAEELRGPDRRALLGARSVVPYRGEVFRFGEALAELDWVRVAVADRSKAYPFTAPWLPAAVAELGGKLRAVYPLSVGFREEPEPVVVLRNTGDRSLSVAVTGPARLREALTLAPGGEQAVTVPDSGLVRLRIGRATKVLYAEGYTQVTIPVP